MVRLSFFTILSFIHAPSVNVAGILNLLFSLALLYGLLRTLLKAYVLNVETHDALFKIAGHLENHSIVTLMQKGPGIMSASIEPEIYHSEGKIFAKYH